MPKMCCFLPWRVLPLGLGSAHVLPGHSPISPAPVQVATPLLGSPAPEEEMTLVPGPSWLCQSPRPAPAIPHLSTETVALILVNKTRDRAQGSWLGWTSVVESDDGSAGAGWPAWRKGPSLLILRGAISSFCSSSRRVYIDQWRPGTLKSEGEGAQRLVSEDRLEPAGWQAEGLHLMLMSCRITAAKPTEGSTLPRGSGSRKLYVGGMRLSWGCDGRSRP